MRTPAAMTAWGLDADALADDGIGRDDRGGMDARLVADGRRREERRDFAEGGAGRFDHDAGEGELAAHPSG